MLRDDDGVQSLSSKKRRVTVPEEATTSATATAASSPPPPPQHQTHAAVSALAAWFLRSGLGEKESHVAAHHRAVLVKLGEIVDRVVVTTLSERVGMTATMARRSSAQLRTFGSYP